MKYLSVCSGIEAATCAWHPLGWTPAAFSEIEKFPSAVLAHHYPSVPNLGDMTKFQEWPDDLAPSLLVGGTPCQSFSIAGLRKGLADPRGNLALVYLALADRYRPEWLVWENVPGVLSSNGGRDFGAFLAGMVELGYGFAYRVLDAQYFGVAQRRRRVFVVANTGGWRRAAAVLFDRHSLSGNPAPRREKREDVAQCLTTGTGKRYDPETETLPVSLALRGREGGAALEVGDDLAFALRASQGGGDKPHVLAFGGQMSVPQVDFDLSQTLQAKNPQAVAFSIMPMNSGKDYKAREVEVAQPLMAGGPVGGNQGGDYIAQRMAVRRLTPRECERLQGFEDDYTLIPWRGKPASECPDGPRYKALGNSMAVPVMRWIGDRTASVASQEAA